MFYIVSKIAFFFATPSHVALMLLLIGAGLLYRCPTWRLGRRLTIAGLATLLVCGFSPLGQALLLPLEERFPPPPEIPDRISGIILLGGFEDGRTGNARGTLALNEAGERLTEAVRLAVLRPGARIIFTGGAGGVLLAQEDAAKAVGDYFRDVGTASGRIVLEDRSRTTWENAVLTRQLIEPRAGERYLLVTSAWHMPRSIGAFRKAGWDVVAWPVDYRTAGARDLARPFGSLPEGLERVDRAAREWFGLLGYYLAGQSEGLWPGPR